MEVRRLQRTPNVFLSEIRCRPESRDEGSAEHAAYNSIVFVRRGAYCLHQGRDQSIVEPFSLLFFRKGDDYSVSHPFGCGDDCVEFGFRDGFAEEVEGTSGRRTAVLRADAKALWRQGVLTRMAARGCVGDLEVEETTMSLLHAAMARGEPTRSSRSAAGRRKVEKAKQLLLSDLSRNWSLADIAREVGASPFHLTRLFRRHAGAPLHRFLTLSRLARALDRILDGEADMTALALDLGFSSHSHFTDAFSRTFGAPPSAARAATLSRERAIS